MVKQPRKPLKWVGSSKRDLDAMPGEVKDVFGHALDLAQALGSSPRLWMNLQTTYDLARATEKRNAA